jgi:hypothetical protein
VAGEREHFVEAHRVLLAAELLAQRRERDRRHGQLDEVHAGHIQAVCGHEGALHGVSMALGEDSRARALIEQDGDDDIGARILLSHGSARDLPQTRALG